MKSLLLAAVISLFTSLYCFSDVLDSDYQEFQIPDLGFSIVLLGQNGSLSAYSSGVTISTNGVISGSGTRLNYAEGENWNFSSANVSISSGQLGAPIFDIEEEIFTRRIGKTNVQLKRQSVTKTVGILGRFDDGCLLKGQWSYHLNREQTATIQRGNITYSWKNLDSWYSGNLFAWADGKTGSERLGD